MHITYYFGIFQSTKCILCTTNTLIVDSFLIFHFIFKMGKMPYPPLMIEMACFFAYVTELTVVNYIFCVGNHSQSNAALIHEQKSILLISSFDGVWNRFVFRYCFPYYLII